MKQLALLSVALVLLTCPAFAVEEASAPDAAAPMETVEQDGVTVNVTIAPPEPLSATLLPDAENTAEPSSDVSAVRTFSIVSPEVPPAADGAYSTMASVVLSVLGEYQRQTYIVEETDTQGNVIATSTQYVPGLAGLDYHWIAGAFLFALFLYGVLRLLGGVMRL